MNSEENKTFRWAWISVLVISLIFHGINMFGFPYYENDEGVYMSQAWSLLKMGKLSPYTYWYDHAPAGWIFIALWNLLTGGFFTFGFSINSGRVFMLLIQVACTLLLFLITHKLTKNIWASVLAAIIFSVTPLGIYFHRRVLLDNLMTFWVMLSLLLALDYKKRLRNIILSAIFFGIAILTKENAIFFIPVFLFIIFTKSHTSHKSFALVTWLAISFIITSFYFIYAHIQGELFPAGSILGGKEEHVSLIKTLIEQYSRDGGGIMEREKSSFWNSFDVWTSSDPVIIYVGAIATALNLFIGIRKRPLLIASFLSLSMWIFLMRGGLVIEFYVIPLLPFLSLNIAVLVWQVINFLKVDYVQNKLSKIIYLIISLIFVFTSMLYAFKIRGGYNLFTSNQTRPQIEAIDFILSRESPSAFYVIDNYGYIDLHERGKNKNFKNAEWYWKVDRDPAVSVELLNSRSEKIDFIALTPQMEHDITSAGLNLTLGAWHNSKPFARFWNDGWGVEFWATDYPARVLSSTWLSYKDNFIKDGRVTDPYIGDITTSEAQAYTMLRAVQMSDRKTFDLIYDWTKENMQQPNKLFTWKWDTAKTDKGTASDADQDMALSLLFAYKLWGDEYYLQEAKEILKAIWDYEVATVAGTNYMTAANWANHLESITFNPSYLNPAYYKIFAEADPDRPWESLIDSSYNVLNECTLAVLDKEKGVLPPEWCSLDKTTLEFEQPGEFQPRATQYGYNAFRVPFRVALDFKWNNSEQARQYLEKLSFLEDEYNKETLIYAAYEHDGNNWETYESVAAYAGNLGYFLVTNHKLAAEIYKEKILAKLFENNDNSYWEDKDNYYTQNIAWFGTALYTDNYKNLWEVIE